MARSIKDSHGAALNQPAQFEYDPTDPLFVEVFGDLLGDVSLHETKEA